MTAGVVLAALLVAAVSGLPNTLLEDTKQAAQIAASADQKGKFLPLYFVCMVVVTHI